MNMRLCDAYHIIIPADTFGDIGVSRWHWGFWLMCVLRCYFTTNSRAVCDTYRNSPMVWSKRITLRWFRTLQAISSYVLHDRNFWVTFVACWGIAIWSNYVIIVQRTCTSESMNPRPCFQALQYHFRSLFYLLPYCFYIFRLQKPVSTIHIAIVSPSLRQTSAAIQFTIVLGVLGTQETLCYLVTRFFERDHLHPTPPTDW